VLDSDPWQVRYFTDELRELEPEDGKRRGINHFSATIGAAPITPEIFRLMVPNWQRAEPHVWNNLLLDAYNHLPDVGSSIVMAYAALETFIAWAIDVLQEDKQLPEGLWEWIKDRDDWRKEPSVSEQFDTLLTVFTRRSLKQEEPLLWASFNHLRDARNALAHEGVATISKRKERVGAAKASSLINDTGKIIAWVEQLLPEAHRRLRNTAIGPFARRVASVGEAEAMGPAYVKKGSLDLAPGDSVLFGFRRQPSETAGPLDDQKPPLTEHSEKNAD
jgi:hypothetical protein